MSYIGNQPYQVAFVTDTFSGNGSTTVFTMSVAPAGTSSVLVAITGVLQDPSTYSVSGTTLTFSAAPPSGTSNISVRYLGIPASGVTTTAYRTLTEFTATAGQTTFTPPSYTAGFINVYRNGLLLGTADYTATNGTTVVLAAAATAGDLIATESFYVSSVLNAIPATAGAVNSTYIANGAVGNTQMAAGAARANFGAGAVLQVVNSSVGYVTTTSASLTDTGLTASITPASASNKVLVTVCLNGINMTGAGSFAFTLTDGSNTALAYLYNYNNQYPMTGWTVSYLFSPATTSSYTYKVRFNSNGSTTLRLNDYSANIPSSYITLMEIAA